MEVLKYIDITNEEWDKNVSLLDGAPLEFYSEWIEFQQEYMENAIIENESWMFLADKKPVCAAVVFIENWGGTNQLSWENSYCIAPIVSRKLKYKQQEKYVAEAMKHIDDICSKYVCKKALLKFEPKVNPDFSSYIYNYNWLIKSGYIESSSLTRMLDLRENIDLIRSSFRKGHKNDVKRGGKEYQVEILDAFSIKEEDIEECKKIYEKDAGRTTRTSEMIWHYYNFIRNGHGLLGFAVNQKGERIATIISTFLGKTGYYLLYAEITDETNGIPPGHILQYKIIQELRGRGVAFYELGEQIYSKQQTDDIDNYEKEKNISFYKRGFGGYTVPVFRGVKYFE